MSRKKLNVQIKIPRGARVLLLEDSDNRIAWFKQRVSNLTLVQTADEAIEVIARSPQPFDIVFLDHDLGVLHADGTCPQGTGFQVAKYLAGRRYLGENVVIHSWNADGAAAMKDALYGAVAIPFGQFELTEVA